MKAKRMRWFGILLWLAMAGLSQAAIITQDFTTGAIRPGSGAGTAVDFVVDEFDTSLGTLISVTFTMTVEAWGGYYSVMNSTEPSAPVNGTMYVGINAYLSGTEAPTPLNDPFAPLFAGQSATYNLAANGDTARIDGPAVEDAIEANRGSDVSSANFGLYEGSGTYTIRFISSGGCTHVGEGAVDGTFGAAYSQGYLTITYEYEPVPEPATVSLLVLGIAALAARRRTPIKS